MEFGVFNVMQQRDFAKAPRQIFMEGVEQVKRAEALGFATNWFVEHHFSNYSINPSPLMMAAHCAGVTSRIRLGTAVCVLPLYQPPRLLAEIAMVDTLSNGRLDVGIGTGYQAYEFERFGVDIEKRLEMTAEIVEIIKRGLTRPSFSFAGAHFTQPRTAINVRPAQQPMPPIWVAGSDPELHRIAAREGFWIFLTGGLGTTRRLVRQRLAIEEIFRGEGRDPASLRLGLLRFVFVTDSKTEAEEYAENCRYQQRLALSLKRRQETVVNNYMIEEKPFAGEPTFAQIQANIMIGDPDTVAERMLAEMEALRPHHLAIHSQVGGMDFRKGVRSLERFMAEVLPRLEKAVGMPMVAYNPAPPAPAAA